MKLLILGGGDSPEREVSLNSAKAITGAATEAKFEVMEADPAQGLDFLDDVETNTVVFPILHGAGGEDGTVQAKLEQRKLPFLGSRSASSANCFDKWKTREVLEAANIPVPKGTLVTKSTYFREGLTLSPHVLKVRHGGSSIGTMMVRDPSTINQDEVNQLFEIEDQALLEELVEGTEITVPILDQKALPVIEIRPPYGQEFSYKNKYNGLTAEICPPETVSAELQAKAQAVSEQVHTAMDCRHLSRVDIIIDQQNNLYVLEINTIPGLTNQSLYPKSAMAAGLTIPDLVKQFVELVKRDYHL